jgi:C_GCAxxG_C_C family probable redox protein
MGDDDCTCGALSGAIMAIGLLAGPYAKYVLSKKGLRQVAKTMHDRFHDRFSSTCCRVLIQPLEKNKRGRSQFCGGLTGTTAEMAAELLLHARLELVD